MIGPLQENFAANGAGNVASISITVQKAITAGSSVHVVWAGRNSATGPTSAGCSDTVNGAYASRSFFSSVSTLNAGSQFTFDNAAAGTPVITVTPNTACAFMGIFYREIGQSAGYDTQSSGDLPNPGTGVNAVATVAAAPSVQPGLMSVFLYDTTTGATILAGTSLPFVEMSAGFNFGLTAGTLTEIYRYTSLASIAGAGTTSQATDEFFVFAAYFKELVIGAPCAWL